MDISNRPFTEDCSLSHITSFLIHDRSSRPYLVIMCPFTKTMKVMGQRQAFEQHVDLITGHTIDTYKQSIIHAMTFTRFWIGYDSRSGWHGNTILVEVATNPPTYIHIGRQILQFTTFDLVQHFTSPLDEDDDSFPVAYTYNDYKYTLHLNIKYCIAPNIATELRDPWQSQKLYDLHLPILASSFSFKIMDDSEDRW